MSWTDERVETLKRMWGEGQSASQIAKELGGVTRNAVIGKVHRLGLSNRNDEEEEAGADTATAPSSAAPVDPRASAPASPMQPSAAQPSPAQASPPPASTAPAAPVSTVPSGALPSSSTAASILALSNAPIPLRKAIVPAGQPLPPQPSANEISPEALASVREVEKRAARLSLMELTERTCKWPIGDPATEDFWFCGLPSQAGKPYCEAHVSVAFQPMTARRDRRR
jgi:GcrA cell cycle regulator